MEDVRAGRIPVTLEEQVKLNDLGFTRDNNNNKVMAVVANNTIGEGVEGENHPNHGDETGDGSLPPEQQQQQHHHQGLAASTTRKTTKRRRRSKGPSNSDPHGGGTHEEPPPSEEEEEQDATSVPGRPKAAATETPGSNNNNNKKNYNIFVCTRNDSKSMMFHIDHWRDNNFKV
jgi:hypothetical protein